MTVKVCCCCNPARFFVVLFFAAFCLVACDCHAQFIGAECHGKATSLIVESVTGGCTAWLRFEPDVVALSVLLLAIGKTSGREDLLNRVS